MAEDTKTDDGLTDQQRVFCEAYLTCWNATKAAKAAGYEESNARFQGSRLLTYANIQAYVSERLNAAAMTANEVMARLARQARGDIADVLNEEGNYSFDAAAENDATHLITSLTPNEFGTAVKIVSSQAALFKLADLHSKSEEVGTAGIKKITVEYVEGSLLDDPNAETAYGPEAD